MRRVQPWMCGAAMGLLATAARAETFKVTSGNDSGAGTLRQAVLYANQTPGEDLIEIEYTDVIHLEETLPQITGKLVVRGQPGAMGYVHTTGEALWVMGGDLVIEDLTFDTGLYPFTIMDGSLSLVRVTVRDSGGMALVAGGTCTSTNRRSCATSSPSS